MVLRLVSVLGLVSARLWLMCDSPDSDPLSSSRDAAACKRNIKCVIRHHQHQIKQHHCGVDVLAVG